MNAIASVRLLLEGPIRALSAPRQLAVPAVGGSWSLHPAGGHRPAVNPCSCSPVHALSDARQDKVLGCRARRTSATRPPPRSRPDCWTTSLPPGETVWVSNFLFHVVGPSRLLGPVHCGVLGTLVNVVTVPTVRLAAVQVPVAQRVVSRPEPSLGRLVRIASGVSVVTVAPCMGVTPALDRCVGPASPTAIIIRGRCPAHSVGGSTPDGVLSGPRHSRVVSVG